jgi:hypothetical protein
MIISKPFEFFQLFLETQPSASNGSACNVCVLDGVRSTSAPHCCDTCLIVHEGSRPYVATPKCVFPNFFDLYIVQEPN